MPELAAPDDAIVRVDATGVCGSDLHIYHGRLKIEPGFTIGHEYVGTVVEAGEGVTRVKVGDRVAGTFLTACGTCFHCIRGEYHRCMEARSFGLGGTMGSLPGTQAEYALVPHANLSLRAVPESVSDEVALFAGDVMGTGYHGVLESGLRAGETAAVLGLGPVGLCAVQVAKLQGARVIAIDSVEQRLALAQSFGAIPLHLEEQDVKAEVRRLTEKRGGVDVAIDAVGNAEVLDMAIRLTRSCGRVQCIGVYAERGEVHLGSGLVEVAHDQRRSGERHRPSRARALDADGRAARSIAARDPPHATRRRPRGVRDLRSPRGAEDRAHAMTGSWCALTRRYRCAHPPTRAERPR